MPVVLLLLDALRYDYVNVNTMPFLSALSLQSRYYKHIIPSYGFCERTEILTGMKPDISGYFTAIGYDKIGSPYLARGLSPLIDSISELLPERVGIPFIKRKFN